MKHIKTINEFFGLFKKNSDEDKIALEFIKRLEKVDKLISSNQGENPYTVEKLSKSYKVIFDDVDIKVTNKSFTFLMAKTPAIAPNTPIGANFIT